MNDLEIGFRTAVVGGFQRDDVLRHIEETTRTHREQVQNLEQKLAEAEKAHAAASAKADEYADKNTVLSAALKSAEDKLCETARKQEEAEQALALTQRSAEELTQRCAALAAEGEEQERECARLRAENERLMARSREYDAARDHLADIELNARSRAAEVERQAARYADRLRQEAEEEAAETCREIERIKAEYRGTLRRTQDAVEQARRYTADILVQFDDEAENTPAEPIAQDDAPASADTQMPKAEDEQAGRDMLSDMLSGLRSKPRAEGGTHGAL